MLNLETFAKCLEKLEESQKLFWTIFNSQEWKLTNLSPVKITCQTMFNTPFDIVRGEMQVKNIYKL